MKINFLSLNDNLGYQITAARLMVSKGWIFKERLEQLERAAGILQEFNDDMVSENNGIEVLDTNNLGDVQ